MVILIMLGVVLWLAIPPMLSRAMVRRGYDGGSYLVVGALFGPVALLFAVIEVLFNVPESPRILAEGRTGQGDLSVLVAVGGDPTTAPPRAALAGLEPRLRRLGLAQVLPKGGPREDERRAERNLRQAATGLGHPELALLFGRPDLAISEHAVAGGYDIVFSSCLDRLPSGCLKGREVPQAAAAAVVRRGSGRLVRGLQLPLDDVGDGWRALLFGAPPSSPLTPASISSRRRSG